MSQYRKKPIVVEAVQFNPNEKPWPDGIVPWNKAGCRPRDMSWGYIQTLEGPLHVQADDWIITGMQGEKYPCKPDIFLATYEAVEQVATPAGAWREDDFAQNTSPDDSGILGWKYVGGIWEPQYDMMRPGVTEKEAAEARREGEGPMRDICVQCGTEQDRTIWPKPCNCGGVIVHRQKCDTCENITGFIIDDDYHTPEILWCSRCLLAAAEARREGG